jgi:hypothetical protein
MLMAGADTGEPYCFQQIHIDAARNSTDDFNPFHEPRKCGRIRGNPYPGPIVLGFQLEQLLEHEIDLYRDAHGEHELIARHELHYSNYQLTFANALLPGERFRVEIKPTLLRSDPPSLTNRVVIRRDAGMVLIGHKRETAEPMFLMTRTFDALPKLRRADDRAFLPGTRLFLKRKFLNTGNAKNFAAGSLCDQGYYFDELEDRVDFPEMFAVSLLSCALLEKAMNEQHDFIADPMVYMNHDISVDRRVSRMLRSNDVLHILVEGPDIVPVEKGLGKASVAQLVFRAFGFVRNERLLYGAEVRMAPLHSITSAQRAPA